MVFLQLLASLRFKSIRSSTSFPSLHLVPVMPLCTSFPSLSFHVFEIQPPEISPTSLPGLSRPSKLALRLLDMANNPPQEESKIDASTLAHQIIVDQAKSTLAANATLPKEYAAVVPGTVSPLAFELLGKYLMSGSTAHIDTVAKCLSMIKLMKSYGLCQDVLCARIITTLKGMVTVEEVLPIIQCVGDIVDVVREEGKEAEAQQTTAETCFAPRDSFFLDYALDHADEIFSYETSKNIVRKTPLIAMLLLSKIPGAYVAKLPKVEAAPEEEE